MKRLILLTTCICLAAMLAACGGQAAEEHTIQTEVGASGAPATATGTEFSDPTRATNPEPTTGEQGNTPTTPTGSTDPTEATTVPTRPVESPVVTDPTEETSPETVATETTVPEIEEDGYNSQIIRP